MSAITVGQPRLRMGSGPAQALTCRLVALIERDRLSVAAAASVTEISVEQAGLLVRLCAIERECAETERDERLEEIQAQCPGEDWWRYTSRQLDAIVEGEAIPNRIVRELVQAWERRTEGSTASLAAELGITCEALRRQLGLVAIAARMKRTRHGRPYRYGKRTQKTITVEAAARVVRALGMPPCEVPGL